MNWIIIFNRLFEIINTQGDMYYSGVRFLDTIRTINYATLNYSNYLQHRQDEGKSTSRRDYYYDILMEQTEEDRITIVNQILDSVEHLEPEKSSAIREIINPRQNTMSPQVVIPSDIWNAERLTEYLENIDNSINDGNFEYTLTLAYTCLEGFYKSFIREKIPGQVTLNELTPMSVQIRNYIECYYNLQKL